MRHGTCILIHFCGTTNCPSPSATDTTVHYCQLCPFIKLYLTQFITVTNQDDLQNLAEPEPGWPLCTLPGDSMASGLAMGHELFCQV